jgi:hypothetical protein
MNHGVRWNLVSLPAPQVHSRIIRVAQMGDIWHLAHLLDADD